MAPEQTDVAAALDRPAAVELVCFWRERYEAVVLDTAGAHGAGACLASLSEKFWW